MFNKIGKKIFLIVVIILVVLFSYYKKNVFVENYKNNLIYEKELFKLKSDIKEFNLSDIKKFNEIEFFYTPYKDLIGKIIKKIDKSKKNIYLEMYMFTEKDRFPKALIRAKKRGVDVKVILEKNPYKALNINNKIFNILKENNIDVVWSNPLNYSLNHSKIFIIDDDLIVSSGNLTYSTFLFNRDFFLFIKDNEFKKNLEKIFLSDFTGRKIALYDTNLVLSPEYSKNKIEKMFLSAQKSLNMYFQYLKDDELEKILIKKAKEIDIKIIVSKNFYDTNLDKITFLKKNNIKVKYLGKYKMHGKAILVDNKFLFIGSENFSKYSLEKNREIGVILKNKFIIQKFIKIFEKDFEN